MLHYQYNLNVVDTYNLKLRLFILTTLVKKLGALISVTYELHCKICIEQTPFLLEHYLVETNFYRS